MGQYDRAIANGTSLTSIVHGLGPTVNLPSLLTRLLARLQIAAKSDGMTWFWLMSPAKAKQNISSILLNKTLIFLRIVPHVVDIVQLSELREPGTNWLAELLSALQSFAPIGFPLEQIARL
jgi:hypothetical protein